MMKSQGTSVTNLISVIPYESYDYKSAFKTGTNQYTNSSGKKRSACREKSR